MRRGCAAICPSGKYYQSSCQEFISSSSHSRNVHEGYQVDDNLSFSNERDTTLLIYRSLKTNSLKLHETITEMSSRMSQLEEALASLQSQVSTDPHPLLMDNNVKVVLAPNTLDEKPPTEEETDVIDSLGTFFIGEKGEVIFHEATATSEVTTFRIIRFLGLMPCINSTYYKYTRATPTCQSIHQVKEACPSHLTSFSLASYSPFPRRL